MKSLCFSLCCIAIILLTESGRARAQSNTNTTPDLESMLGVPQLTQDQTQTQGQDQAQNQPPGPNTGAAQSGMNVNPNTLRLALMDEDFSPVFQAQILLPQYGPQGTAAIMGMDDDYRNPILLATAMTSMNTPSWGQGLGYPTGQGVSGWSGQGMTGWNNQGMGWMGPGMNYGPGMAQWMDGWNKKKK